MLSKNILRDQSKSIFSGLIEVAEGAQYSNALQTNRNLLLSDEAEANSLPGLEILVAIIFITLIGWISLSFLGKKFFEIFNNILKKIPILRTIYSAIGQMTESLTKTDNKQKSVVLLEYPRKGVWAVGFATKENEGIIKDKINQDLINVFVPTTPNPTSGFLLMVPKKDLIYLEVSFEQASKFIVSAGTTNIN